jgi:predicted DCC family thiol-disulfide oxidoreductase YuxK
MTSAARSAGVVLYDSDCGFCRWALDKILSWDRTGNLRPVALQSAEAAELLDGMPEEERMASWHLLAADGKVYSGGAAAAPLLRLLPRGSPVAALVAALPGPTDRAYRWVARNRDRLGRLVGERACAVDPTRNRQRP